MVQRWVKEKVKLKEAYDKPEQTKKKLKLGGGRKLILSTIIKDILMEKIAYKREQQHHVSTKLVTFWATKMASENGITDFAASHGWLFRFLQRFKLMIGRTTTGQVVAKDVSVKLHKFVEFNKQQRDIHRYKMKLMMRKLQEI